MRPVSVGYDPTQEHPWRLTQGDQQVQMSSRQMGEVLESYAAIRGVTLPHHLLPAHCANCGVTWPEGANGICPACNAGLPCRADTTDTVAPDPPCPGSRARAVAAKA